MVEYSCEKCGKKFSQKGHYTKHINKKNPCVIESKVKEIIEKVVSEKINKIKCNENINIVSEINENENEKFKFIDLFCGIGSFHYSFKKLNWKCVMSCDNDKAAKETYKENYGLLPLGDITEIEPKNIIITVNAGFIPDDHWTQNKDIGGGRIIGEACHFIDLVRYLIGHEVTSIQARALEKRNVINDSVSITLGFSDGSCGTIMYLSNGSSKYPKERVEVFVDGKVLKLDNFIKLRGYGWKNFKKMNLFRQDKGQHNAVMAFKKSIENGRELIPIEEIFEVAEVTIKVSDLISNQN